jgi:hypothetical protein
MTPTPSEADRICAMAIVADIGLKACALAKNPSALQDFSSVDRLIAARVAEAVGEVQRQYDLSERRATRWGDMADRERARAETAERERDELRKALEAYREAYAPDGHSSPHDCFATGPLTGNAVVDYIQCPGCHAEKLYLAATKGTPDER